MRWDYNSAEMIIQLSSLNDVILMYYSNDKSSLEVIVAYLYCKSSEIELFLPCKEIQS